MSNHSYQLVIIGDDGDAIYRSLLRHPTRNDNDLRQDYRAIQDALANSLDWRFSDVLMGMKTMGWVEVEYTEVRVDI